MVGLLQNQLKAASSGLFALCCVFFIKVNLMIFKL